jgi:hypothetical protein
MAEPDAFDPTQALDGWRAPAPAPVDLQLRSPVMPDPQPAETVIGMVKRVAEPAGFDPTQALDGWRAPAPEPPDLRLRVPRRVGLDDAKMTRLKARGYEMVDVEDIEVVEVRPASARVARAEMPDAPDAPDAPLPSDVVDEPEAAVDVQQPVASTGLQPPDEELASLEASSADAEEAELALLDSGTQAGPAVSPVPPVMEPAPVAEAQALAVQPLVEDAEVAAPSGAPAVSEAALSSAPAPLVEPEPDLPLEDVAVPEVLPRPVDAELPVGPAIPSTADVSAPFLHPPAHDIESPEPALSAPALVEAADYSNTLTTVDAAPVEAVDPAEAPALPCVAALAVEPDVQQPAISEAPADLDAPPGLERIGLAGIAPPRVAEEAPAPSGEGIARPEVERPQTGAAMSTLDFRMPPLPVAPDLTQMLRNIGLPHAPRPSAETDLRQLLRSIELPGSPPPPAVAEVPVIDIPAPPAERDPRLLAHWQPQAWTALVRRIAGASAEVTQTPDRMLVAQHAPQWLCALWPPQPPAVPLLGRWPELAALVAAEGASQALQALLAELPADAAMWQADLEMDWGLVADLVLQQDAGLRPAQTQALRELAEAERQALAARLSDGYSIQGSVARRRS